MATVNKNQLIIAGLIATIAPHIGWGKINEGDAFQIAAAIFALSQGLEPYIIRIFNHYFPQGETK